MPWWSLLKKEVDFPSDRFYRHKGTYVYRTDPPDLCPVCGSSDSRYHAHGSFLRWLTTCVGTAIRRVRLRKPRWKCLSCGHTFSRHPPEGLAHKPTCNFLIVVFLWTYLASPAGLYGCLPGELADSVSERTLARHLKRAKEAAEETQQFIREVLIEKREPRPVEDLFQGGLDPPESLLKKQRREPEKASTLYRALVMLLAGAKALDIDPRTLLAWANRRSQARKCRFLL